MRLSRRWHRNDQLQPGFPNAAARRRAGERAQHFRLGCLAWWGAMQPSPQGLHEEGARSMKTALALIFTSLFATAPAWAINKCTGANGKVVYQDAPCEGGKGEALTIRPVSGPGTALAVGQAQVRLDKLKSDNAMSEAIRTHKPMVGMTPAQLQDALGAPTKMNADNYSGTQRDQLIFERPTETWYVYTRNGIVESIQHRPGVPIGAKLERPAARCPSQHEIRNAITSASSMTLGERERAERWKAIRSMQECGK